VIRCLSFHAAYRCRHSGACCTAGWAIPFDRKEAARVESLQLTGSGRLVWRSEFDDQAFAPTTADGACGFFERESRLCAIHVNGGPAALPSTCRMFPRVVLHDARGTSLTLSHFCPTAAASLFDEPGPDAIVDAPQSLVGDGPLEGLDATSTWTPLLRRSMLMDLSAYGSWERQAIDLLTSSNDSPWQALGRLERATATIAQWTPGRDRTLDACVDDAFASAASCRLPASSRGPAPGSGSWKSATGGVPVGALFDVAVRAVPSPLTAPFPCDMSPPFLIAAHDTIERHRRAVNRWLAARLFASWIAYQSTGLLAIVRLLRVALDTLVVELTRLQHESLQRRDVLDAIRRSDYLLVHLADSQRLATLLSDPCLSSTGS
jgi:Fe-S-cluster containining protein